MNPSSSALRPIKFLVWLALLCGGLTPPVLAQVSGAVNTSNIQLADPTIFSHNGLYYLYGTVEGNSNAGFQVYTSPDLKNWEGPRGVKDGFALRKGDVYGDRGFWAPHIFYHKQKFYMAYTANEQIAIATSNSPLGPFTQSTKEPLAAPVKQIDPYVFFDTNGKAYLYHVRLTNGNRLFVAEMQEDLSGMKPETLKEAISAQDFWENTAKATWPVSEGPSVIKHKKKYYFIYSANDFRNPDYAVGYAVSHSPYGPWQKYAGNPIISRHQLGLNGTGHGDLVKDKKGQLYYVMHTHQAPDKVGPRKTALVKIHFVPDKTTGFDKLVIDVNSFHFLQLKNILK